MEDHRTILNAGRVAAIGWEGETPVEPHNRGELALLPAALKMFGLDGVSPSQETTRELREMA